MNFPDCERHNPVEDPPDELDAYGHLTWVVGTIEDEPGWLACFDAVYDVNCDAIHYEVVVDGGSFVDTPEKGSVSPDKADDLKGLPDKWHEVGLEACAGLTMDEQLLTETRKSWADHIDDIRREARDSESIEAATEQSLDYFNRHIAGDR